MNDSMNPLDKRPVPPALQERLEACPGDERHAYTQTWTLAGLAEAVPDEATPDLEAMWQRIAERADAAPRSVGSRLDRQPQCSSRLRLRRGWLAVGVSVVLVGLALFGWLQPITVTAPVGERLTVVLPDASEVELNSGAMLTYHRSLGPWVRHVRLHGEAFFDVTPAERSFVVETFNAAVTVLGTTFNVRAWPDEQRPETRVVLASGAVGFAPLDAPEATVRLNPGEMSWLTATDTQPHAPEATTVDTFLAWRAGGFAFIDQPLDDILSDLIRRYGMTLSTTPALQETSLALYLDPQPDVTAVLDVICAFLNCQYEATATGYHLF